MNTALEYTYDYYQAGGSLKPNALSYVVRQADEDLYDALMAGQFCYVLNSRQMGKSSLRVQTMQRLKASGVSCAAVDITKIGSEHLTPKNWYGGMVSNLWLGFDLFSKVNQKNWLREHEELSLVQLLDRFIEEVLLVHVPGKKIVIFVDEIDSIISLKFSINDFFALIRAYYNQRVDQPEYERLTFCLLGVATPSDLITDKARTPFNIGKAIALDGFKFEEAKPLEKGLVGKVSNPQEVLREILHWTGGQPFLTQKLCKLICEGLTVENPLSVEQVVRSKIIENWESQDEPEHLKTIRDRLLGNKHRTKQLLGLYQSILQQEEVEADKSDEQMELRLTGLVVKHGGKLKVYNPIYKEVFNQNWLNQELAKLRPYAQTLRAWVESQYQDDSQLLRGQAFEEGWNWLFYQGLDLQDKFSIEEHRFLIASRVLDKRGILAEAERETIKLAEKLLYQVGNPLIVIRRVLSVTRAEPVLAQKLFRLILNGEFPIRNGDDEGYWVERIMHKRIIDNWEIQDQPQHLRKIRDGLLENKDAARLLQLYRHILQSGKVAADDSPKQLDLLRLGLVVNRQGKLKVGNRIYEAIFSLSWVDKVLEEIKFQNKLRSRRKITKFAAVSLTFSVSMVGVTWINFFSGSCPAKEKIIGTCVETLTEVKDVPSGTFSYGGSTSFAPLRSPTVITAIQQAHPSFHLKYVHPKAEKPGSQTGIRMLLNRDLSFAQSSRDLDQRDLQNAKKKGFELKAIPIAIDGIAIFVNAELPIRGLTVPQLQQIFTGEINNWKYLGGHDLPIHVFIRDQKANGNFFKYAVLHEKKFGPFEEEVAEATKILNKVAETPGGIGYATPSEVVNQKTISVKLLPLAFNKSGAFVPPFSGTDIGKVNQQAFADNSYPITRKLYAIIKKDGGRDEQAGTAYANLLLSVEGQKLVEKSGFLPIRALNLKQR